MTQDNRPARYIDDDGRVIYRASSLGLCDKIFVALAMDYEPRAHPGWFQEILDEGTRNEEVIRGMWEEEHGIIVANVGMRMEMEITDGVWLAGSIDGLNQGELWEAKKIRDSGWDRYLRSGIEYQANYPMQMSAYMHMLAELYNCHTRLHLVGGHYVQDPKTEEWSITEIHTHYYDTPPINLLAIKRRIVGLERLIKESVVIGDVKCTHQVYPCPMFYLHDEEDGMEPPVRPTDDIVAPLAWNRCARSSM